MTTEHSTEEGRFVHGKWIEAELPDAASPGSDETTVDFGARIAAVRADLSRVLGEVADLGKDILQTNEGRQHIESQVKKVGDDITSALNNLGNEATKSVEQAFEKIKQ